MRSKVLGALVVGGLLVGAGLATSLVSAPSIAQAQEDTDSPDTHGPGHRVAGFLQDLLGDLVGKRTITQDQADAIIDAAQAKAAEMRDERHANRDLIRGFLEDGVITKDEASQLPEDHPLLSDRFDEAWADGELTRDEIDGVLPHPRLDAFRRGFGRGLGLGLLDDGGIDQEEYDALPDDNPLKKADVSQYLEDGLITPDELRQLFHGFRNPDSGGDA
jgi:hypothetical protein